MKAKIDREDLKQVLSEFYKKPVKHLMFDLDITTNGNSQRDMDELPVFKGCAATFEDSSIGQLNESDLKKVIGYYFGERGYKVNPVEDVHFNMGVKYTGNTSLVRKAVPKFEGCMVDYQEKTADTTESKKQYTSLADMRRDECYQSLMEMPERDMLAAIKAHFDSHPTRQGEKDLKEQVNIWMNNLDNAARMGAAPVHGQYPPLVWRDGERESMARQFANTRIREFSVTMAGINPEDLNQKYVGEFLQTNSTIINVSRVNAELSKNSFGDIFVHMEKTNGTYAESPVPNKYYASNPMNVKRCSAEVEITDWSNKKMMNVSAKVVVDTDLMSGDVVDLRDDTIKSLDQISGKNRQEIYAFSDRMGRILNSDPHCKFDGDKLVLEGADDKITFDFCYMRDDLYLYLDDTNVSVNEYYARRILSDPKSLPCIDGAKLIVSNDKIDAKVKLDLSKLSDDNIRELSCDEEDIDFANAVASIQETEPVMNK